ncbi:hypothetical protein MUU46_12690 [Scandinavium sp. TWS1a]|uniref:HofO family protein n=1 Tax=Scandinavium tedordense TaxID=2926521 RepID=UPI00216642CC|nr:hypothetical protein [Scandinavium tedordense]MCS2171170.1 hypothetical protein [Scandinavium tedordense]
MLRFADRWCDFSPRVRLGIWLMMLGGLAVAGRFCSPEPLIEPDLSPLNAQWQKIMPLLPVAPRESPALTKPFSALDMDSPGSRVVSWQPAGSGGELTLEANWAGIPPLFNQLAERGRAVREFSIQPEQQHLRLTLLIEANGDD